MQHKNVLSRVVHTISGVVHKFIIQSAGVGQPAESSDCNENLSKQKIPFAGIEIGRRRDSNGLTLKEEACYLLPGFFFYCISSLFSPPD